MTSAEEKIYSLELQRDEADAYWVKMYEDCLLAEQRLSESMKITKLMQQLEDSLSQNYCTTCGTILENCDGKLNLNTSCTLHPIFIFDINKPWCPACLLSDIRDMEDESIRLQDDVTELRRRVNELEEERK